MSYHSQPPYGQPQYPGQNPQYPRYGQYQSYSTPGSFAAPGMPNAGQYYPQGGPPAPNNSTYPPPGPPPVPGNRPQNSATSNTSYYTPLPAPPPGQQQPSYPPLGSYATSYAPAPHVPDPSSYAPSYVPPPGPPSGHHPQQYGYPPPPANYNHGPTLGQFYLGAPVPPSAINKFTTDPPVPGYDARGDVEAIHKATKGFGTDESALIRTLAPLNALQVAALATQYKAAKGRDLPSLLSKEASSWFGLGLRGIVLGPIGWDVELVRRAISGVGTHEDLLNEILLSRTNEEINMLKSAYRDQYGRNLEQDVSDDLSMKTKQLFTMALNASRVPDTVPVRPQDVDADVEQLYKAGVGRRGTNEMVFCEVLVNRSGPHLTALCTAYHAKYKMTLTRAIKKEFSGHMRDALLYIAHGAKRDGRGILRDAKLMEAAMAGLGTKDERLVWRIVRAHWDRPRMEAIKAAYQQKYKKSLASRVKGETSGDYQKLMLQLIG